MRHEHITTFAANVNASWTATLCAIYGSKRTTVPNNYREESIGSSWTFDSDKPLPSKHVYYARKRHALLTVIEKLKIVIEHCDAQKSRNRAPKWLSTIMKVSF